MQGAALAGKARRPDTKGRQPPSTARPLDRACLGWRRPGEFDQIRGGTGPDCQPARTRSRPERLPVDLKGDLHSLLSEELVGGCFIALRERAQVLVRRPCCSKERGLLVGAQRIDATRGPSARNGRTEASLNSARTPFRVERTARQRDRRQARVYRDGMRSRDSMHLGSPSCMIWSWFPPVDSLFVRWKPAPSDASDTA